MVEDFSRYDLHKDYLRPQKHFLLSTDLQPGAINLTTDDGGRPVDICCDRPGVSVICEMETSQVNPNPNIGLLVNSFLASNLQTGTDQRRVYRREFKFRPKIGGIYRVGCMIENSIFHELSEDKTVNITIYSKQLFDLFMILTIPIHKIY